MEAEDRETLARGYAWGYADAQNWGSVAGTQTGIEFGIAYRRHIEEKTGHVPSVQNAYVQWKETGTIVPPPVTDDESVDPREDEWCGNNG